MDRITHQARGLVHYHQSSALQICHHIKFIMASALKKIYHAYCNEVNIFNRSAICRKEGKGFGKAPPPPKSTPVNQSEITQGEKRFELEPYNVEEWREWLDTLKKERKAGTDHLYVQVQLDGSVRSSGEGAPSWERLLNDLPVLDSLRTRITDGLRR